MSALVEFEHVTKRYGERAVVDDLSFRVEEGSVTGLLGPNGAGKTTAMRLLLNIAHANSGRLALFGVAPGSAAFHAAVRRVGAHVEEPALYANTNGRANLQLQAVSLGLSRRDPRIDQLLDRVGLSARAGTRVKNYSLGMRQRLGLALALLNDPELVILDEPTNGLDPAGVVEIRELIRSLPAAGTTVLVSSHVLAEIQRTADHLVIIDNGRLVADGTIDEVIGSAATGAGAHGHLVRVDAAHTAGAAAALQNAGLTVADGDDGMLAVSGAVQSGAQVAYVLAQAGYYPEELRPRAVDLETAFLSITGRESNDAGGAAR